MSDNGDRERQLCEEIARELPDFVQACDDSVHVVIMHQDAFAPLLGNDEILLLGKAIKYAGLCGKEVRIIPPTRRAS